MFVVAIWSHKFTYCKTFQYVCNRKMFEYTLLRMRDKNKSMIMHDLLLSIKTKNDYRLYMQFTIFLF